MRDYNINSNEQIARQTKQTIEDVRKQQQQETNRDLYADILKAALSKPESRADILIKNNIKFPNIIYSGLFSLLRNAYNDNIPFTNPDLQEKILANYIDIIAAGNAEYWEGSLQTLKNDKLISDLQTGLMSVFSESNSIHQTKRALDGTVIGNEIDPHVSAYDLNNYLEKHFMQIRDKAFSEVDNRAPVEIFDELTQMVEDAKNGLTHEIQWGIKGMNNIVPLRKGELTIIGARSGHGKTAFVISCIVEQVLGCNYKIGGYFGELNETRVYARLIAQYANERKFSADDYLVTYNNIFSGFCSRDEDGAIDTETFNQVAYDEYKIAKNYITTVFTENLFIKSGVIYLNDLLKNIRDLKQMHDIKCYYVDYLQWVETEKGDKREKREKIEDVIRALNALSSELNIPIVPLAQLNRGAHNTVPQSNHISGSDIPFNECDNMILLDMPIINKGDYNDRKYEFNGVKAQMGDYYNSVVVNVAKQRDGAHQGEAFLFGFDPPIAKVTQQIHIKNQSFEQTVRDNEKKGTDNGFRKV